ncbi:MAG: HYR domain-containing protein, partial [Bacteroidetes bacterium]|nr:HYR domain-containing protein [Bacteroidota bacterium]
TDVNGNTATCTQTVTVTDDEDPIITCSSQTLSVDAGLCGAANTSLTAPTTSDNCGVATVTNDAPSTLPVGTTTVNWTVTDVNGNTATCAQTVTVTDDEDPTITCPSSVSVNADAGSCDATNISLGTPTTADNCGVATTTNDAPSSFPTGNTTVTWTVTDVNGNTATCTQVVTVVDNIIPTITCPATVSVNADAGSCTASNVGLGTPTTSDNCSVASVTNDAPSTFPLGSTTVTWTVTDSSGNTSSCGQTVTVLDAELPTITCPADVTTTGCGATSVTLGTPTTADNCSVATVTNDAPALFPLGTTSVVWTVTDGSGNTATCTQTVMVTGGVDTSIAVSGNTYTANAAGSTYQWYDCGNNTNVSGATGQSFTPTTSGSYALIVTSGGCTDTSACFPVIVIGINNVIVNATLKVFPNPATETVNVQVTGTINGTAKVQLFDVEGRLVRDFVYENMNGTYPISLINLAADVYELRITTAQGIWNSKVMKVN